MANIVLSIAWFSIFKYVFLELFCHRKTKAL
jgi:hypothetical protein